MRVPESKTVTITISISIKDAEQFLSVPPKPDELTEDFVTADVNARIAINKAVHAALKGAM